MYVCMSENPEHVSMYVCLTGPRKYVCMYVWGSWACMYVCLTQSYKIRLFRRVSNSLSKPIKIYRLIHFFLNCEGEYFREPSWAPNVYVCMFELQDPEHVCMYVWHTQASMYVCLRLLNKYVCMSHSKLQNQLLSEGVKFLIKTLQNLTFNSFFCWIVRGGTSESLAGLQTCMYVCLSSRPTPSIYVCMYLRLTGPSKYVCMSEAPAEHVCMYVSANWACMYVCLRHTEHVCMYVSNIHR